VSVKNKFTRVFLFVAKVRNEIFAVWLVTTEIMGQKTQKKTN